MAVNTELASTRLQMVLIHGYDDGGKPILRTRTYSNVKTDADNEDIYNVAQNFSALQIHDLDKVIRVDESKLFEE
ncbi:MAG: DUF1659 domain-containing protein [Firmicutes bacterium]|jgi:hypothetical protein|nr:DUF1659 domain-containing protein [Bacillota bacterium]